MVDLRSRSIGGYLKPAPGIAVVLAALALTSCALLAQPQARIPVEILPAQTPARRLVVVLPGQGDDLKVLRASGIGAVIQEQLADAEVALVELTLTYYMEGRATQRLHDEVIVPARNRGIREIYLAGASMGGMGVLMYEREHAGEVGLVLMAPFMGNRSLMREIETAGSIAAWQPGPVPTQLTRGNVPREEWRVVKSWLEHRERTRNVWLICGTRDRFYEPSQMLATVLPKENSITPEGGHKWTVWTQGASEVFAAIAARPSQSGE